MNTSRRIGLWFGSLLLGAMVFSFLFCLINGGLNWVFYIFGITMMFALPVSFLYLPFVVTLKDAEARRIWTLLVSGTLIGPASLVLRGLLLQLRGGDVHEVWIGNGLDEGVGPCIIYALPVGFMTTAFYVIALKIIHRPSSRLYR